MPGYSRNAPEGEAAHVIVPEMHSSMIICAHSCRALPDIPAQFAAISAAQVRGLHALVAWAWTFETNPAPSTRTRAAAATVRIMSPSPFACEVVQDLARHAPVQSRRTGIFARPPRERIVQRAARKSPGERPRPLPCHLRKVGAVPLRASQAVPSNRSPRQRFLIGVAVRWLCQERRRRP